MSNMAKGKAANLRPYRQEKREPVNLQTPMAHIDDAISAPFWLFQRWTNGTPPKRPNETRQFG